METRMNEYKLPFLPSAVCTSMYQYVQQMPTITPCLPSPQMDIIHGTLTHSISKEAASYGLKGIVWPMDL